MYNFFVFKIEKIKKVYKEPQDKNVFKQKLNEFIKKAK